MPVMSRETLADILSKAASITEKGQGHMEILKTARLSVENGHMNAQSTDLENALFLTTPVDTEEEFACCVDPRKVSAILKNMPDEVVTFGLSKDTQEFFIQGENAEYRFGVLPAEDFPTLPQKEEALFTAEKRGEALADLLSTCLYAVSNEEARLALCGVCLDFDVEEPEMVATDGRRLVSVKAGWTQVNGLARGKYILPTKAVRAIVGLARRTEIVRLHFSEGFVGVEFDDPVAEEALMMVRPIEGEFPDWRTVLPTDQPALKMTVNVKDFRAVLRRMKEVLKQVKYPAVFLDFTDSRVRVTTVEDPEASLVGARGMEYVEAEVEGQLETGKMAFNLNYLHDLFSVLIGEQATLELWEDKRPTRVEEYEYLHLLMPMAL